MYLIFGIIISEKSCTNPMRTNYLKNSIIVFSAVDNQEYH